MIYTFKYWELASMEIEVEADNEDAARRELARMRDNEGYRFDKLQTETSDVVLLPTGEHSDDEKLYKVDLTVEVGGRVHVYAKSANDAMHKVEESYPGRDFDLSIFQHFEDQPVDIVATAVDDEKDVSDMYTL